MPAFKSTNTCLAGSYNYIQRGENDMKIYIDVLMITNSVITMCYVYGLYRVTHTAVNRKRLMLTGLIGGVSSLLVIIQTDTFLQALLLTLLKITAVLLTIYTAFGKVKPGKYLTLFFIYVIENLLFGGCCFLLWEATGGRLIYFKNYTIYFDISLGVLVGAAVLSYIILSIYDRIQEYRFCRQKKYKAQYKIGEYQIEIGAIADSGNMLRDVFSGMPVVVFYSSEMFEHFDLDHEEQFKLNGFRLIPCSTIAGERLIPITSKGEVTICDGEEFSKAVSCYVGIVRSDNNKSRAIFNPCLLV